MNNEILKKLRKKVNLTQREVAEALCVDVSTYAKIEQGKNQLVGAYYQTLADIFNVDKVDLFRLYSNDENTCILEGGVTMSMTINKILDFGTVRFVGYDDYMFECFSFALKKAEAKEFIDYIDKNTTIINDALTKIDPDCETLAQYCYLEDTAFGEEFVEFGAAIPDCIKINGHWVVRTERGDKLGRILSAINDLEPETVKVKCKMFTGEFEGSEAMQLQLVELEIDEKLFAGLDIESTTADETIIALADLPEELQMALYGNDYKLRSIDEILDIAKKNEFPLREEDARYLFRIWCC